MNNIKHNDIGGPKGLRAGGLYTSSPDAVQRLHPEVNLRSGKAYADPVSYDHPWPSMRDYARLLALRYEAVRTRHSYYRDMRLLHEHFGVDPASLTEAQVTDYLLHVKLVKGWKPKTVRQTAAAARLFGALRRAQRYRRLPHPGHQRQPRHLQMAGPRQGQRRTPQHH